MPSSDASPDTLAMNVLGEKWWPEILGRPPERWFSDAFDAWRAFFDWLWLTVITDPRHDDMGRVRPEGHELELFRKTLPRFATFQKWYYRQMQRERSAVEAVYAKRLEEQLGLVVEPRGFLPKEGGA